MLSITLNGGNGLLKAACGSCAAIRAAAGPTISVANSRLANTLAVDFMLPPLRDSVHLIEAQQLGDFLGRKAALFHRHLAHCAASFVGLYSNRRGAVVADLRG